MEEVDANDNGIATHDGKARYAVTTTLASRVANLRPHWNDPEQDFDKGNLFRNIDNRKPRWGISICLHAYSLLGNKTFQNCSF